MSDQALARYEEVVEEITSTSPAKAGKLFGMPSLTINKKGFAGYFNGEMVFKLSGAARDEALAIAGSRLFDPMGGRPMKEWVQVPFEQSSAWSSLALKALEFVLSTL